MRRHGPLRIDGRQFEPMGSLKTRELKSAKVRRCSGRVRLSASLFGPPTPRRKRNPALFGESCWPNFHWRPALPRRTINHHRPIPACTGDRECCAPACSREASMPQSQILSSVVPFAAIGRPACPKCKALMMLVTIEPTRARGVDLHTFECAVCNQVLKTFAAYEDPMRSKGLGRWLQGELHPPK